MEKKTEGPVLCGMFQVLPGELMVLRAGGGMHLDILVDGVLMAWNNHALVYFATSMDPEVPGVTVGPAWVSWDGVVTVRLANPTANDIKIEVMSLAVSVVPPAVSEALFPGRRFLKVAETEAPARPAYVHSPVVQMQAQMDRKREILVRLAEAALRGGMVGMPRLPDSKGQEAAAMAIAALREIEGSLK